MNLSKMLSPQKSVTPPPQSAAALEPYSPLTMVIEAPELAANTDMVDAASVAPRKRKRSSLPSPTKHDTFVVGLDGSGGSIISNPTPSSPAAALYESVAHSEDWNATAVADKKAKVDQEAVLSTTARVSASSPAAGDVSVHNQQPSDTQEREEISSGGSVGHLTSLLNPSLEQTVRRPSAETQKQNVAPAPSLLQSHSPLGHESSIGGLQSEQSIPQSQVGASSSSFSDHDHLDLQQQPQARHDSHPRSQLPSTSNLEHQQATSQRAGQRQALPDTYNAADSQLSEQSNAPQEESTTTMQQYQQTLQLSSLPLSHQSNEPQTAPPSSNGDSAEVTSAPDSKVKKTQKPKKEKKETGPVARPMESVPKPKASKDLISIVMEDAVLASGGEGSNAGTSIFSGSPVPSAQQQATDRAGAIASSQLPAKKKKTSNNPSGKAGPNGPKAKALTKKVTKTGSSTPSGSPAPTKDTKPKKKQSSKKKTGVSTPTSFVSQSPAPELEEDDDGPVYCLCNMKYEDDRPMICCDKCTSWYHPSCCKMKDSDIDLIDVFVCPECMLVMPDRTTYKIRCKGPNCFHGAKMPFSKFCGDECGIKFAEARLREQNELPIRIHHLTAFKVRTLRGISIVNPHFPDKLSNRTPEDAVLRLLQEELNEVKERQTLTKSRVESLDLRLQLVYVAIDRGEALPPILPPADALDGEDDSDAAPKKKKVAAKDDKVCGYDRRLTMDDEEWDAWLRSDPGVIFKDGASAGNAPVAQIAALEASADADTFCGLGRKKCDRHSNWQKVRPLDLETEYKLKMGQLVRLKTQVEDLEARISETKQIQPLSYFNPHKTSEESEEEQSVPVVKVDPPKDPVMTEGEISEQGAEGSGNNAGKKEEDVEMSTPELNENESENKKEDLVEEVEKSGNHAGDDKE